ncbi:rotatin-like [Achroia grisella]|uniref:rotatin-like n=1 Tax=Achroia grisella TaxID=688607 RepID=UPI0027D2A5E3|nr:rotatin-like [Achroia grisella]
MSRVLSSYITKLNHPLKEIRERALKLLRAKLELGWKLEDELSNTREILEALLAWFHVPQPPTLQREVIDLLHTTIKTKAGTYICKEFGIKQILSSLDQIKDKIDEDALEIYEDIIDILRFINTVESEENITVPRLNIPSMSSSESEDVSSSNNYCNLGWNFGTSKETADSNEKKEINTSDLTNTTESIKLLLFPWVELAPSDLKTINLIEDSLKLLKSTRRCCRFIRDVFLRDFPPEIFLNRPKIVKNLLSISEGANGGRPGESLQVLLYITHALRKQLIQFSSVDLIHETNKVSVDCKELDDNVNIELEQMTSDDDILQISPHQDDGLAALRQLPAPTYAHDTLHSVLSIMARSVVLVNTVDKTEVLDLKELNTCLSLVECLIKLLTDCVSETFWSVDHNSKTLRDISHKSCMVMRLLGDLLMKYSKSFTDDSSRIYHRIAWLRLVQCAECLLSWARESALPPTSLILSLQVAQLDPALQLLYPEIHRKIALALQNARTSVDQEYKSKYRELTKLFSCMDDAVKFMKNKNRCRNTKDVLICIKKSLPVLELHQSEIYINDVANMLLDKIKDFNLNDKDWSIARNITLKLMAHNLDWVRAKFYIMMADMVKLALITDDAHQSDMENRLMLLCDVEILTEICCQGLSSNIKEVESSASEIILYLLRGRMVFSESCWWRLLASMLPVFPLLHVYAAHDTQLGQAIWRSVEADIANCMGIPVADTIWGRVRMLFVRCVAIQLEAAHSICQSLDDDRYLPPKESLRADVLLNALRRVEVQDFNIDYSSSPSKTPQTTGLLQIVDVLKQDLTLDEDGTRLTSSGHLTLEPSLRRGTLQQLAVMLRQQELHETFLQYDGIKLIVAILRLSLMVDDYLAFPECAISCVSILNSICFVSRHTLLKIQDLAPLLIRVILVFPADESAVSMTAQVLSLTAWAGFALQELAASTRRRVPSLPAAVVQRTALPFATNTYWHTSPNAEHSSVEWLLSEEPWRAAVRVRWWCSYHSGASGLLRGPTSPGPEPAPAPLSLQPTPSDLTALRAACPLRAAVNGLLAMENATSHRQVVDALNILESYLHLLPSSCVTGAEMSALPWQHTRRFLAAPPASSRDSALLIALMQFILIYMDTIPTDSAMMSWIKSYFIGSDSIVISLLSRDEQSQLTPQENIEVTQLHIHIVKVILRCVMLLEYDDYDSSKLESLLKILLACLEKIDLKNFHMLGYLNELIRCIRYVLHSRYCKLSENTLLQCLQIMTNSLSGCASGGGCKGQACRLDICLVLLALMRQINEEQIPVQRWCDCWSGEVMRAVASCGFGSSACIRAATLQLMTCLLHHVQLLPQLLQAIPEESLSLRACRILCGRKEANVVRAAAARLLAAVTARTSPHSNVLELEVLEHLKENSFLENCLEILIDFCNEKEHKSYFELNVPLSILERRAELEVRAQKRADIHILPTRTRLYGRPPPTADLIAVLADVVHNTSAFTQCPVQEWNEQGLYRLLFRCASWRGNDENLAQTQKVRAASCRALAFASMQKCVRSSLAATKDCLYSLLMTLTPLEEDEFDVYTIEARSQALLLLGSLLGERAASETVWYELRNRQPIHFFSLLLQSLQTDEIEFQSAGLYCLSQLIVSTHKKLSDKTTNKSLMDFFDNVKSPFALPEGAVTARSGAGDVVTDCRPDYMAEELCKAIIHICQKSTLEIKQYQSSQNDAWVRAHACAAHVIGGSVRARLYAAHRRLPRTLLLTLQALRDHLSVVGKPADIIRNADHNPVLHTLYWVLIVIDCQMVNCMSAKEAFAEDNITVSLCRLWPWCMMTERLRFTIIHLLYTFVNNSPKAWSAMCVCVSGRSLAGEVCALASREATLVTRCRRTAAQAPHALLLLCMATLRRILSHHQCRSIFIKSEVLRTVYVGGARWRGPLSLVCEALARHPEGAAALLALLVPPASASASASASAAVRAALLPALAHAAAHHRSVFLQSPHLLELLSGTLLTGDTEEVTSASRAVWALAANNHKAKLQLRSSGVVAAVYSALQRLQRELKDPAAQRVLQLLTYTNNILQAT